MAESVVQGRPVLSWCLLQGKKRERKAGKKERGEKRERKKGREEEGEGGTEREKGGRRRRRRIEVREGGKKDCFPTAAKLSSFPGLKVKNKFK